MTEASEAPETTQTLAIPLGYPPELDDGILFLKTSCVMVVRYKEIKFKLSKKLSSCWLAFMRPKVL